ncbi:MAG TPA: GntR family transcriptional regulator [Usitatibacter sp.]|jgi:GntR family transcriptional regulator|nr:GntR family transcriptional regulator [Usitatibacter sp.]
MATHVDRAPAWSGERPLYQQVKERLIARISRGEWAPGVALPGEPALAAQFGVSISTIRAAVRELVDAAVLDRIQGRGTFVASRGTQDSVYQFFHLHPDAGPRELPRSELVAFARDSADSRLAHELNLGDSKAERRIYRLRNVLRMDSTVVQVSDIAVPEKLFPGLTERRLTEAGQTLYAAYQALYGITVVRTRDTMKADRAPRDIAALFSMPKGSPVLGARRVAFTFHDVPIESRRTFLRTDRFHYRLDQGG